MIVKLTASRPGGAVIYERVYNNSTGWLWLRGLAEPIAGPWLIKVEFVKA
jgi:hypothetical protein